MKSSAFTPSFKTIATCLVAFIGSWFFKLHTHGLLPGNGTWALNNGLVWVSLTYLIMLYTLVAIHMSFTSLSETHLKQHWMFNKEVKLDEIIYAKLIRVPFLDWLIAPRLYVKTFGKFHAFYAASPEMLQAFEKLASKYQKM